MKPPRKFKFIKEGKEVILSLRELLLEKNVDVLNLTPEGTKRVTLKDYVKKQPGTKVVSTPSKEVKKSEEQVVKECTLLLKKKGWITKTLWTGGIPTKEGGYAPNPAKGIPDCIAFHISSHRLIWIEYKKSKGGIISPEQQAWHNLLDVCKQEILIISSKEQLEVVLNKTNPVKAL